MADQTDKPTEEKKEEEVQKPEPSDAKALEGKEKPAAKPAEPEKPKEVKKSAKPVKVSGKLAKIIEEIETLSVLELADLVKALEDKFGVAAAPMAVAPSGSVSTPAGEEKGAPEQTTFDVVLTAAGANKISVIKAVREINQILGLKEAKDLVEAAPKEVLTGVKKEEAEEAKKKLTEAGASVELK